jgi:hypothetical protein
MNLDIEKASELQRKVARARAIVQSVVGRAMQERADDYGSPQDRQNAYDLATTVAALMIQQIYENDAELFALRKEAECLRRFALDRLNREPIAMFLPSVKPGEKP